LFTREIGLYFAERDTTVESRFYTELDKTIRMLADSPELGERCQFRNPETKGMRIWQVSQFSNYLIFYLPKDDLLEIVRRLSLRTVMSGMIERD
jgi:plasmid stabilization system protein ParE